MLLVAGWGSTKRPRLDTNLLLIWDGNWYRAIMLEGYPQPQSWPPGPGGWTVFPFFPLYPMSARLLHDLGAPMLPSLLTIPNLAALAALFGIYQLVITVADRSEAMASVWIASLLPGTLTFSMAYPDSLFLAGCVWALVLAMRQRPVLAGLVALVATTSRPNGALIVLVLVVAVVAAQRDLRPTRWLPAERRRVAFAVAAYAVPSVIFLAAWCWFMNERTGDPLAFLTAKQAWHETTLWEWVTDPTAQVTFQLSLGVVGLAVILLFARRLPAAWTAHGLLCVAPALIVGTVGMARYTAQAFVIPIALGIGLASRRAALLATLGGLVIIMAGYSYLITRSGYVP